MSNDNPDVPDNLDPDGSGSQQTWFEWTPQKTSQEAFQETQREAPDVSASGIQPDEIVLAPSRPRGFLRARMFFFARIAIAALASIVVFIAVLPTGVLGQYYFVTISGDAWLSESELNRLNGFARSWLAGRQLAQVKPLAGNIDSLRPVDASQAQTAIDFLSQFLGGVNSYGVVIADGQGEVVAQKNLDTVLEPASTMKTLTALATVMTLDMDASLDTSVEARFDAQHQSTVLELVGGGDMLLGSGQSDPNHINGHAGLQTLVDQTVTTLKKRGISTVTVDFDDSLFGAIRTPATMDSYQGALGNYTPISSMAIHEGKAAQDYSDGNPDGVPQSYPARSATPALDVATLFIKELKSAGINVKNSSAGAGADTADNTDTKNSSGSQIAVVHSAMLSQVLRYTLQQSDNTLIEELGRLVALAQGGDNSPTGATKAVMGTLAKAGVNTKGMVMADCSGLSDGSQLSVRTLVEVQEKFLTFADASAVEGLSVTGISGTALEHGFTPDSAGLIRLKTGTLPTVTSMSGNVVRRGGGILYFAIIINDAPQMWDAGAGLNRFVDSLVDL